MASFSARIACVVLLLSVVCAVLPVRAQETPPKTDWATVLPGVWRGVRTIDKTTYHHRIKIDRQGDGFVAEGISWCAMTEEQAHQALRDELSPTVFPHLNNNMVLPMVVQQKYTVSLKEGRLTLSSTGLPRMVRGQAVTHYHPRTHTYDRAVPTLVKRTDNEGQIVVEAQDALTGRQIVPPDQRILYLNPFASYKPDLFAGKLAVPGILASDTGDPQAGTGFFRLWKEEAVASPAPLALSRGEEHALTCLDGSVYHYTVYLPKSYDPTMPMPVLMHMSPSGDAKPLSPKMAESLGWIMVGLTESRNGEWAPVCENRDAALFDLRRRFNVDWKHVYFSGFSGGARAAAMAALSYPESCVGLFCVGASAIALMPLQSVPIYYLVGELDPAKETMTLSYNQENQAGRKTLLVVRPGVGHAPGTPEENETALAWLAKP